MEAWPDAAITGAFQLGMEASRLRSAKDAHANHAGITRFGCFARRCRLAAAILALPSGVRGRYSSRRDTCTCHSPSPGTDKDGRREFGLRIAIEVASVIVDLWS